MKKLFSLVVLVAVVFALAACNRQPDFKKADLRLANTAIAEDLDLHTTSLASDFLILGNMMEGLVRLGDGDVIVDGVAKVEDTVVDSTGTVYTFKLREGAKWSNGDEITANDFVYSWKRAMQTHEDITVAYASMFFIIKNAEEYNCGTDLAIDPESGCSKDSEGNARENFVPTTDFSDVGVVAKDDYTLEVTLTKPVPYFMQLMAFPAFFPAHQKTIEKYGIDHGKSAKNLVFNGPFKVTYWNADYGLYLEKNDRYWDAKNVKINSWSLRKVEDTNTLITLYDAGEIDRVGVTGSNYLARKDDQNITVQQDMVTWYLVFNNEDTNFSNANLRKFFMYGIDKKELVAAMAPYVPTDAFVPKGYATVLTDNGSVDYRDFSSNGHDAKALLTGEPNFEKFDGTNNGIYDATEAQAFLDAARTELGIADGTDLTVNFKCFDAPGWQPLFEQIMFQVNEYEGINLVLDKKPSGEVYDSYDANTYEFGFYGWGPDYPDPMTYLELYHSKDSHNVLTNPNTKPRTTLNASYDALIEDARDNLTTLADPVLRYEKLVQAEKILLENAYVVPLANRAGGVLTNNKVEGIVKHNFGPDYSYKWVTVTK